MASWHPTHVDPKDVQQKNVTMIKLVKDAECQVEFQHMYM